MALTDQDIDKINHLMDRFATKADIAGLKADMDRFVTKDDLGSFATKADLDRMESRLTTSLNLLQRDTFNRLDQHEARISRLEQARP